jgi:hypothetical protein
LNSEKEKEKKKQVCAALGAADGLGASAAVFQKKIKGKMSWRLCVLINGFNSARAAKVGCSSRHAAISSLSFFSMCPGQANLQSVSRARCEAVLRERLFRTVLRQLSSSAKPPRGQADARDDKDEGQSVRHDLHRRCNF